VQPSSPPADPIAVLNCWPRVGSCGRLPPRAVLFGVLASVPGSLLSLGTPAITLHDDGDRT